MESHNLSKAKKIMESKKLSIENVYDVFMRSYPFGHGVSADDDRTVTATCRKISDFLSKILESLNGRRDFMRYVIISILSSILSVTKKKLRTHDPRDEPDVKYLTRGVKIFENYRKYLVPMTIDRYFTSSCSTSAIPFEKTLMDAYFHLAYISFGSEDKESVSKMTKYVKSYVAQLKKIGQEKNLNALFEIDVYEVKSICLGALLEYKSGNFSRALFKFDVLEDLFAENIPQTKELRKFGVIEDYTICQSIVSEVRTKCRRLVRQRDALEIEKVSKVFGQEKIVSGGTLLGFSGAVSGYVAQVGPCIEEKKRRKKVQEGKVKKKSQGNQGEEKKKKKRNQGKKKKSKKEIH